MRTYTMGAQVKVGKAGVSIVSALLEEMKGWRVESVEDDPVYRKLDIDLRGLDDLGQLHWVEVKYDTYASGNFFFELAYVEQDKLGCTLASEADWYAYVFPAYRVVYLFNLWELQTWLKEHQFDYPPKIVRSRAGNRVWRVMGIAVPIQDVLPAVVDWEMWAYGDD